MEYIDTALQKANRLRRRPGRNSSMDLSDASYTHTKKISVNKDVLRENRIIAGFDSGPWIESFRVLRTRILHKITEHDWNLIGISSAEADSGKSLIATNLAISLAMKVESTVLLVDTNLQDPCIHKFFGLSDLPGLNDYLAGDYELSNLLIHPDISRLIFLPAGNVLPNSSELLASRKMMKLVREVKKRYASRIIIFDLPPILHHSDALALSPHIDGILLVIEDGKSQAEDVKRSVDLLSETHFLGTVLNKSLSNRIRYS